MDEKPKSVREPILTRLTGSLIGFISIASTVFALSVFGHFFQAHGNPVEGQSVVFASFAVNSMVYIFAYRSLRRTILRTGPLSRNKPLVAAVLGGLFMAVIPFFVPSLRSLLGIVPLTVEEWSWVAGGALGLLLAVELAKVISLRLHSRSQQVADESRKLIETI